MLRQKATVPWSSLVKFCTSCFYLLFFFLACTLVHYIVCPPPLKCQLHEKEVTHCKISSLLQVFAHSLSMILSYEKKFLTYKKPKIIYLHFQGFLLVLYDSHSWQVVKTQKMLALLLHHFQTHQECYGQLPTNWGHFSLGSFFLK